MKYKTLKEHQIIEQMGKVFSLDTMLPSFGDFIRDNFGVISTIQKLDDEHKALGRDSLHHDLLVFAESLLGKHPIFLPLASTILGYVSETKTSSAYNTKVFNLFCRINDTFSKPETASSQTAIETYFCAARMVAPDSELGRQLKQDLVTLFNESDAPTSLAETFHVCAESRYNTDVCDAILRDNFLQIVADFTKLSTAPTTTEEEKVGILYTMAYCSAHIAFGLPDGSSLEDLVINQFFKTFDEILHLDKDATCALMEDLSTLCEDRLTFNRKFLLAFAEERNAVKQAHEEALYDQQVEGGSTARKQPSLSGIWFRGCRAAVYVSNVATYH